MEHPGKVGHARQCGPEVIVKVTLQCQSSSLQRQGWCRHMSPSLADLAVEKAPLNLPTKIFCTVHRQLHRIF